MRERRGEPQEATEMPEAEAGREGEHKPTEIVPRLMNEK